MDEILVATGISKTFPGDPPLEVVRGLDIVLHKGELGAITGVSGKGKSTVLNLLGGIMRPDAGSVLFHGEDISTMGKSELDSIHKKGIGFVFQTPYLFEALTARENLIFASRMTSSRVNVSEIDAALEEFGLIDRAEHLPSELSVGQRRRLMIARVMLSDHEVILADEPTNDLDRRWTDYVLKRFKEFAHNGGSVMVVTHDMPFAAHADSIYVLEDGCVRPRRSNEG